MWAEYWGDIDPGMQTGILSALLRETRAYKRMYWRRRGSKFATVFCGRRWTITIKLVEYGELPQVVARVENMAVLLCCDRQSSRAPASVLLNDLITAIEAQLPRVRAGVSKSGDNERIEDEIGELLKHSRGETTINALAGALLGELRGR